MIADAMDGSYDANYKAIQQFVEDDKPKEALHKAKVLARGGRKRKFFRIKCGNMYQNVDDTSILIMGHHHFHILGFYIPGFHLRFSEILKKKLKSVKLLFNICSTF